MSLPKSNIAILLLTNSYQIDFTTLIGSFFKSQINFRIQKTDDGNGNQAYSYKTLNAQEAFYFNSLQFPAALSHGNFTRMQELKQKIRKNFEFTEVVFVDTPEALAQSNATQKIHIQICSKIDPDTSLQNSIPLSFKYLLASVAFQPQSPKPDLSGNFFNWTATFVEGFAASNYGTRDRCGDPFVVIFDNEKLGYIFNRQEAPQSAPIGSALQYGNFEVSNTLIDIEYMAEVVSHEIGHVFDLEHWLKADDGGYLDYHPGNDVYIPAMGGSILRDTDPDKRFFHWSSGEDGTCIPEKNNQDDFHNFAKYLVPIKLRGEHALAMFRKDISANREVFLRRRTFDKYYDFIKKLQSNPSKRYNNLFMGDGGSSAYSSSTQTKLSNKRTKLINAGDIKNKSGLTTIEGLIGFPGDFDLLKIILKEGEYSITEHPNAPGDTRTSVYLSMAIVNSNLEISKSQKAFPEQYTEEDLYFFQFPKDSAVNPSPNPTQRMDYICDSEALATTYPEGSAEGDSLLAWSNCSIRFRRPEPSTSIEILENDSANGVINGNRPVQGGATSISSTITVRKTCMIYLMVSGGHLYFFDDWLVGSGFSDYGSIGKYYITITKKVGSANLQELLPAVKPPNCYPTEKIKCILNDAVEDIIFFTQDPEDYAANDAYDNTSDHPNAKKYNIVINGKLCKIPFLLQGKEYGLEEDIQEKDKKQLFAVDSTITPSTAKIQEFIVAPEWDYVEEA